MQSIQRGGQNVSNAMSYALWGVYPIEETEPVMAELIFQSRLLDTFRDAYNSHSNETPPCHLHRAAAGATVPFARGRPYHAPRGLTCICVLPW